MISINPEIRRTLSQLYGQENIEKQWERYCKTAEKFSLSFGEHKDIHFYSSPARVEIGGNHTDHQGGKVIAVSVDTDIVAVVAGGAESINIISEGYNVPIIININDIEQKTEDRGTPKALVKGVLKYLKNSGYMVGGFSAYICSNVPEGSGLSSSAAFESLIAGIINDEFNGGKIPKEELAKAGKYAENIYFGKACGLMDQMAASVGGFIYIDFKDADNPYFERINADIKCHGYVMCVVNTGLSHAGLDREYSLIPEEMSRVSGYFNKSILSEVDETEFFAHIKDARKQCGDRAILRAIHFFGDTNRVERQRDFLRSGDIKSFLNEVSQSGKSSLANLQNIYAASNYNEQSLSIALALCEKYLGEGGVWRVHGGGFAGTILVFVDKDLYEEYCKNMERVFGEGSCTRLNVRPFGVCRV
ncbi:MAG: galactokinase [Clostridiales bacterium]|jgi:galactokinase|nr:galactokinase [Clostridiales bacterium]